jgi:DNA-binding GntR family transcriptional regulator
MRIDDARVRSFWRGDDAVTLEERVYRFIHELIVSGEAVPGSPIVGSTVATTLGVSRITVANALRRLSSEGFVIVYPHRRAEVAALDETTLDEIFRIRYALEAEVMTELAATVDDTCLARLRAMDDAVRESLANEDPYDYRQAERRFHLLIYELSCLPMISSLLTDLWNRLEPYRGRRFAEQMLSRDAMDDHERVLTALARRDGAAAIAAMRAHVERGHAHLKDVLHPEHRMEPGAPATMISAGSMPRRPRRDLHTPPGSLREALRSIPDGRRRQGRMYAMGDILTLCACAMLCGTRSRHAAAHWIATAPPSLLAAMGWQQGRVPSMPTIQRLLAGIDGDAFRVALEGWLATYRFGALSSSSRKTGATSLPGLEVIEGISAPLMEGMQTHPVEGDDRWRRFFGRMLYGDEMPPEVTPAELQLRMACLHTAGSGMP